MKKIFSEALSALMILNMLAAPVYAASDTDEAKGNKKTVVTDDTANPNTGAVTLAGVSVALAGAAIIVSKKKK